MQLPFEWTINQYGGAVDFFDHSMFLHRKTAGSKIRSARKLVNSPPWQSRNDHAATIASAYDSGHLRMHRYAKQDSAERDLNENCRLPR